MLNTRENAQIVRFVSFSVHVAVPKSTIASGASSQNSSSPASSTATSPAPPNDPASAATSPRKAGDEVDASSSKSPTGGSSNSGAAAPVASKSGLFSKIFRGKQAGGASQKSSPTKLPAHDGGGGDAGVVSVDDFRPDGGMEGFLDDGDDGFALDGGDAAAYSR